MKPGLAILPMEVWADAFEHPLLTRELLAQIADNNGDPGFTAKLQKFLHDPMCGKHQLRYLLIYSIKKKSSKCQVQKENANAPNDPDEYSASLAVAPHATAYCSSLYKGCDFPEYEMPENINSFKHIYIEHLDDQVLDFLDKIQPLFTNVYIKAGLASPRVGGKASIRGICCTNDCFEFLQRHFPDKLALAKELDLLRTKQERASIRAYLNWLCAPQDFGVDAPKFLQMVAYKYKINAIVKTIRKHFLAATSPSTYVIYVQYFWFREGDNLVDEFQIENAATIEQMTARNAHFKTYHYVEIMRHPIGANANMRKWVEQRAYYEKKYQADNEFEEGHTNEEEERIIEFAGRARRILTIGHISKKVDQAGAMDQAEDKPANEDESADQYEKGYTSGSITTDEDAFIH